MLKNYILTAWRSLKNNRTTSVINIGGLAVGITAAVFILLWVQNELSFDNMHNKTGNIYRLTTSIKENNWVWETTPLLLADAAGKALPEIENITRLNTSRWPVLNINGSIVYEKNAAYIDDSWFSIFKYDFLHGNARAFAGNPAAIIITETTAKRYFDKGDATGKSITIDSSVYQVAAVVKDAPANSSFQFNIFLPLSSLLRNKLVRENDENWDNYNYLTFITLKEGINVQQASKKLTRLLPGNEKEGTLISLLPLKDMHFETGISSSSFVHGNRNTVYIFSVIAFLLLLVACINYVNLTTAKASIRAKEVSIRKLVGAKRQQLFYQFITESVMVSIIALFITILLMQLCLPAFNAITGKHFIIPVFSAGIWKVTGITLLTALALNSIYPALLLSSFKPLNVFRGATILKIKDSYFRKSLVVLQFTIAVALVACTIIIYRQMKFVQQANQGYNRSQALSLPLPNGIDHNQRASIVQALQHELGLQSSIEGVAASNQPIINIGSMSTGSADWDGHDASFKPGIAQLSADADFQRTLQLQMKEGRWFLAGNEADKNNVVLNETAAELLNIHKPVIGQRFTFKGRTGKIIGIVKDFTYKSLHDKTGPLVAFNDPAWFNFLTVRIAPGKIPVALATIQRSWKKILPGQPLEYNFLDDSFNALYNDDQQVSLLIFVFAGIAVIISALGLFGLAAFTAEQRTREIGIRKVLGASVGNIVTMLSGDFVKLVAIGILLATPAALFAMNRWIENFAYRISIDYRMFIAAGVFALVIAILTISAQAIKAAVANPVRSLRSE